MKKFRLLIVWIMLFPTGGVFAQNPQPEEILVSSWKTGTDSFLERTLEVGLTSKIRTYQEDLRAVSGRRYRFRLSSHGAGSSEYWKAELRKVLRNDREGPDLLYFEGPDPPADNFPVENKIAFFYPYDEGKVRVNNLPWNESGTFYPLKTVRKIKVLSSLVILKAGDVTFDASGKTIISFKLLVKFQKFCE